MTKRKKLIEIYIAKDDGAVWLENIDPASIRVEPASNGWCVSASKGDKSAKLNVFQDKGEKYLQMSYKEED